MPRYEFTCRTCAAPYEVRLTMSEYAAGQGHHCPACGSDEVERRFTGVSVLTGSRSSSSSSSSACCGGGSGFS